MSNAKRTVTMELPEDLAANIEACGLLAPGEMERLLTAEVRRRAWERWDELRAQFEPVEETEELNEEIMEIIKESRRARRHANTA